MKKHSLFIALFLLPLFTMAADSLLVYQVSGSVKKNNSSVSLKTGNKIATDASITLGNNSSVSLICESYVSFTINTAGTHTLSSYKSKCLKTETAVTSKYFKYVWEQFTHPHASPESQHREFMKNAGGVSRGCPGIDLSNIPDTINYTGGKLSLVWEGDKNIKPIIYLSESPEGKQANEDNGTAIFAVPNHRVSFEELSVSLKPGMNYEWKLGVTDKESCETKYINYVNASGFESKLEELKKLVVKSSAAEEAFMLASILTTENYYDAATSYYEKAVKLAPKNNRYKAALNTHRAVFGLN